MRALLSVLLCTVLAHAAPVPKNQVDSMAAVRKAIEAELDALDKPQARAMATLRYASVLHHSGDTKASKAWLGLVKLPPFNPERQYEHSMYITVAMMLGEAEKAEAVYSAAVGQTQDMMQRVFRFGYVQALLDAGQVKSAGELLAAEQNDMLGIKFHLLHASANLKTTKDVDAGVKALDKKGLASEAAQFWCTAVDVHIAAKDATKAIECRKQAFELMTQRGKQRPSGTGYHDLKSICELVKHVDHRAAVLKFVASLDVPWMSKATKSMELAEALARHKLWTELPALAEDLVQVDDRERFAPLLLDAYMHLNQPEKADELLKSQQPSLKTLLAYQRCLYYLEHGKLEEARMAMTKADDIGGNAKTLAEHAKKGGHDYPQALRKRQTARALLEGAAIAVTDLDEVPATLRLNILLDVLLDVSRARPDQNR